MTTRARRRTQESTNGVSSATHYPQPSDNGKARSAEQEFPLQRPAFLWRALEARFREQLPATDHVGNQHGCVGIRVAVPCIRRLRNAQRLPQRRLELLDELVDPHLQPIVLVDERIA